MKEQLESLNAVSINFGEEGMMAVNIIVFRFYQQQIYTKTLIFTFL